MSKRKGGRPPQQSLSAIAADKRRRAAHDAMVRRALERSDVARTDVELAVRENWGNDLSAEDSAHLAALMRLYPDMKALDVYALFETERDAARNYAHGVRIIHHHD